MEKTLEEIIGSLKETPKVDKWEYRKEEEWMSPANVKELNKLGEEGWELVQIYKGCSIFKRKIQQK